MRELKQRPPNYSEIKKCLRVDSNTLFAYGDTLYNPSGNQVDEDVWVHEATHQAQQKGFTSPEAWWDIYLTDKRFRLEQELQAYAAQYSFIKRNIPKIAKEALFDYADTLSSGLYATGITYSQAENEIRQRAKAVVE